MLSANMKINFAFSFSHSHSSITMPNERETVKQKRRNFLLLRGLLLFFRQSFTLIKFQRTITVLCMLFMSTSFNMKLIKRSHKITCLSVLRKHTRVCVCVCIRLCLSIFEIYRKMVNKTVYQSRCVYVTIVWWFFPPLHLAFVQDLNDCHVEPYFVCKMFRFKIATYRKYFNLYNYKTRM